METIYTVGYSGWDPLKFVQRMQLLHAHVLDIRLKPWSKSPSFRRGSVTFMAVPEYSWIGQFGNLNYAARHAPVHLMAPAKGIEVVRTLIQARRGPFVLLCGCPSPTTCHRLDVARLLGEVPDLGVKHIVHLFPHGPDEVVR